jgi:hypothetical protein
MTLTTLLRTAAVVLLLGASILVAAGFPDPIGDNKNAAGAWKQAAVLAGGCFWCEEAVFQQIEGVDKVVSGYSGGAAASAHYEIVSARKTEHAESVQLTYDSRKISYGQLLKVFFEAPHNPTKLNRQGIPFANRHPGRGTEKVLPRRGASSEFLQPQSQESVCSKRRHTKGGKNQKSGSGIGEAEITERGLMGPRLAAKRR